MYKVESILTLIATAMIAGVPAYSQEYYHSEVTAQGMGTFVKQTTQYDAKNTATNSGGFLAGYRYYFTRHIAAEIDYAYALNTQNYRFDTGTTGVNSHSHEETAAFVYAVPFKRWSLFGLAGGGAVVFDPKNTAGTNYQARAAFVYGAGVDYSLTSRLFVRVEYRGLVYDSPDFDKIGLMGYDRTTHRAEPSMGIGYRF